MFGYKVLGSIALLVLGIWWCKEVIERWHDDVEEVRTCKDRTKQVVIIGIWIVTVVIAFVLIIVFLGAIERMIRAFG